MYDHLDDEYNDEYNFALRNEEGDWLDDLLRTREPSAAKWEHPTLGFIEFARFHLEACKSDAETARCLENLVEQLTRRRYQLPSFDLAQVLESLAAAARVRRDSPFRVTSRVAALGHASSGGWTGG